MGENLNEAELPTTTNPFERFVVFMLQKLDKRTGAIERNVSDIIETQTFLVNQMVTHDELREFGTDLNDEITTDLKNYTSAEFTKYRNEITALIKKCDGRADDTVAMLGRRKVLDKNDSQILLKTSPFTI